MPKKEDPELIARYADMLSAMGTEPRLRIVRLLLTAHPEGMVVGEVGEELGIPSSTLSHHLEKLKNEDLVRVRREAGEHCRVSKRWPLFGSGEWGGWPREMTWGKRTSLPSYSA